MTGAASTPGREELLAEALAYAARGWRVLPLHYPTGDGCSCVVGKGVGDRCWDEGKHPALRNGVAGASTDPAQIRRWWASKPWNVGVATGAGLLVLDVDPRHGGDVALEFLEAERARLPRSVIACTGGGGLHLWYYCAAAAGRVPCSVAKLGAGLDVRADGGYVVAPPSLHASGRLYGWELSSDPADVALDVAPAWLLALAQGAERVGLRGAGARGRGADLDAEVIPDGARGDTLYRVACSMRSRGLDDRELLAALEEVNAERCRPPVDARRLRAIASSAAKRPPGLSPAFEAQRAAGERSAALSAARGVEVGALRPGDETPAPPEDVRALWREADAGGEGLGEGRGQGEGAPSEVQLDVAEALDAGRREGPLVVLASPVDLAALERDVPDPARERAEYLRGLLGDAARVGGDWQNLLTRGRKGALESSPQNLLLILRNDPRVLRGGARFNELTQTPEVGGRKVMDAALTALRVAVETRWSIVPAKGDLEDALRTAAELDAYHPVREHLRRLRWDGRRRIEGIAREWFGARGALDARFLECFLVGAVRRAFRPGCQHRTVLVLVGDQNIGKSTFFRAIGGEWFNESKIETVNKDGLIVIHSAWLHEFPEVDQLTLFREAAPIKALITAQWDTFRAPYARGTATILRSCLFGATTNEECFLRDESGTGSSRWHPVYVNRIPTLEEMARERDQILAEAFALAAPRLGDAADPRSFLTKDEERQREELAADFRQVDPWDAALSRWLKAAPEVLYLRGKGRFAVPAEDVLSKCLKLREPGVGEQRRLSGLMKRRGWAHDRQRFPVGRTTPGVPARLGEPEYCYLAPDDWKPFDAVVDDVDHPAHLPD